MAQQDSPRPIGAVMGEYVWDGANWMPRTNSNGDTFDGVRWHPRAASNDEGGLSQMTVAFADPRYAFALTKRTSDDLQFIVRYTKVMIILGIVAMILWALMMILGLIGVAVAGS